MVTHMGRPPGLFDREWEWTELCHFADNPAPGLRLGLVSGRRRQGKSFLLRHLAEGRGFYYEALEGTPTTHLADLGRALAEHLRLPAPLRLPSWHDAIEALAGLARDGRPVTVVLDELPYLASGSPELPSLLQRAVDSHEDDGARTRLILCGSAIAFMGRLLSGAAPLRGRARLDLVVMPFDFRTAARFWGLEAHPALALGVHSIVGGTPAYRRDFVAGEAPRSPQGFDRWVAATVLNPARPLFREGRQLLAEEPDMRQSGLYHAILGAVARGHTTRGGIASQLGRASSELHHPLGVLEDAGFITREDDAFRHLRPAWRINDPIVRFHHAIMRPIWSRIEHGGDATPAWRDMLPSYRSLILGPHLEGLAREWVRRFASAETTGAIVGRVAAGTVNDAAGRTRHQVDVAAFGVRTGEHRPPLLMLGEAKVERMTLRHLDRLRRIREVIAADPDVDASGCRLGCFSASGFDSGLSGAGRRGEAVLVDLERLYLGS